MLAARVETITSQSLYCVLVVGSGVGLLFSAKTSWAHTIFGSYFKYKLLTNSRCNTAAYHQTSPKQFEISQMVLSG